MRCALASRRGCAGRQAAQAQIRPKLEQTREQHQTAAGDLQLLIMARQSKRPQASRGSPAAIIAESPLTPRNHRKPRASKVSAMGLARRPGAYRRSFRGPAEGKKLPRNPLLKDRQHRQSPVAPRHEESPAGKEQLQGAGASRQAIAAAAAALALPHLSHRSLQQLHSGCGGLAAQRRRRLACTRTHPQGESPHKLPQPQAAHAIAAQTPPLRAAMLTAPLQGPSAIAWPRLALEAALRGGAGCIKLPQPKPQVSAICSACLRSRASACAITPLLPRALQLT